MKVKKGCRIFQLYAVSPYAVRHEKYIAQNAVPLATMKELRKPINASKVLLWMMMRMLSSIKDEGRKGTACCCISTVLRVALRNITKNGYRLISPSTMQII
jgi:hypothetical protein